MANTTTETESPLPFDGVTPPEGWRLAPLSEFGHLTDGDWILQKYYTREGVRLIQVGDIGVRKFIGKSERYISLESARQLGCSFLRPGQILISRMPDPIGRACVVPNLPYPAITAVDVAILTPDPALVDTRYALHVLNHQRTFAEASRLATGATRQRVSRSNLGTILLVLPNLVTQRAIASVLDSVDGTIAATDNVNSALKQLKRSLMRHLFTYGPVPPDEAQNVQLKETEIGQIPVKWNVRPVGEFASTTSGGTPNRARPEYYGGEIPWVKSGELEDAPVKVTAETLTPLGLASSSAKLFQHGTLLVAMYGATAGRVGILEIAACTNQAVCAIFPEQDVADPRFLFYALIHRRDALLSARYGGAQPNVSQTILRNFAVPVPADRRSASHRRDPMQYRFQDHC